MPFSYNKKRCLNVLGDPWEALEQQKGFDSCLAPVNQSFFTTTTTTPAPREGLHPNSSRSQPGPPTLLCTVGFLAPRVMSSSGMGRPPSLPPERCRRQKPPIPTEIHMTHRLAQVSACTRSAAVCNHSTYICVSHGHSCTHM